VDLSTNKVYKFLSKKVYIRITPKTKKIITIVFILFASYITYATFFPNKTEVPTRYRNALYYASGKGNGLLKDTTDLLMDYDKLAKRTGGISMPIITSDEAVIVDNLYYIDDYGQNSTDSLNSEENHLSSLVKNYINQSEIIYQESIRGKVATSDQSTDILRLTVQIRDLARDLYNNTEDSN